MWKAIRRLSISELLSKTFEWKSWASLSAAGFLAELLAVFLSGAFLAHLLGLGLHPQSRHSIRNN